jgi:hypothetical protein
MLYKILKKDMNALKKIFLGKMKRRNGRGEGVAKRGP